MTPTIRQILLFGSRAPYLGPVANRGVGVNTSLGSAKQIMSRTACYARDNISSAGAIFPNFYVTGLLNEAGPGSAASIEAAIEDAAGNITRLPFSGADTGSIANNSILASDVVPLIAPIAKGALFYVRSYFTNASGVVTLSVNRRYVPFGDAATYATSGVVNQVMGGAITASGNGIYIPAAVIGMTRLPTAYLTGTSRTAGLTDLTLDASLDYGELARSIGPSIAYINGGMPSDTFAKWNTGHTNRLALSQYCSTIICEHGTNDIATDGKTAAQTLALAKINWAFFGKKPIWQATAAPRTTSTDSWATLVNQTPVASEAERVAWNGLVRAAPGPLRGMFDIADAVESSRDSGLWKVDGTASKYTADGIHESTFAALAIQSSGAVNPAAIRR